MMNPPRANAPTSITALLKSVRFHTVYCLYYNKYIDKVKYQVISHKKNPP
jgi:hypothetical protein